MRERPCAHRLADVSGQEDAGAYHQDQNDGDARFRARHEARCGHRRDGGVYGAPDVPASTWVSSPRFPSSPAWAEKPLKLFGANAINKLSQIALPGIGKNCVVLGAQIEGVQGAIFLRKRGKNVTVLEDLDTVGEGLPPRYKSRSLKWLRENDVETITGVEYRSIDKRGITYVKDGEERYLKADSILVFKSPGSGLSLYDQLKDLAPEVYPIGACQGPGSTLMVDAVGQAEPSP